MQLSPTQRAPSRLAIGLKETRIERISQQRHVTKDIVKNIRLLEILKLRFRGE